MASIKSSRKAGSKRRQVLANRLGQLGKTLKTAILPVEVYEIWGFGSFFRAKERPNDVDIVVKYKKSGTSDLLYHLFHDYMEKAIETYRKEGYDDNRFPAPKDAWFTVCLR